MFLSSSNSLQTVSYAHMERLIVNEPIEAPTRYAPDTAEPVGIPTTETLLTENLITGIVTDAVAELPDEERVAVKPQEALGVPPTDEEAIGAVREELETLAAEGDTTVEPDEEVKEKSEEDSLEAIVEEKSEEAPEETPRKILDVRELERNVEETVKHLEPELQGMYTRLNPKVKAEVIGLIATGSLIEAEEKLREALKDEKRKGLLLALLTVVIGTFKDTIGTAFEEESQVREAA